MTSAKLELLTETERSNRRYHDLVAAHAQLSLETTNRKALETELFNSKKLEAIGRLTGRFAHEFNNLLTVVSGNLEFLDEAITDEPFVEILRDAQTAASRGATLIQAMLAYSQRTKLSVATVNLNSVIQDIIARDIDHQNNAVRMELGEVQSNVNVDQGVLKTAILHLIDNAHDAIPPNGSIHVQTDEITYSHSDDLSLVSTLTPGRYVRLSIIDNGGGIPPENLQQVFDPFYTTKPAGAGTGLGLSMTLGFMLQSGGTVGIESALDEGTAIRLYFPV